MPYNRSVQQLADPLQSLLSAIPQPVSSCPVSLTSPILKILDLGSYRWAPCRQSPGNSRYHQLLLTMDLSPQHNLQVEEFVVITGIDALDPETSSKAAVLLSHHNFNLNNAVLAFFETGLDLPPEPEPIPELSPFNDDAVTSGAERFEGSIVHRNLQDDFAMDQFLPKLPKAPRISNKWQFDLGIHMSRRADALLEKELPETPTSTSQPSKRPSIIWMILLIIPRAFSLLFSLLRLLTGFRSSSVFTLPTRSFNYEDYEEGYDYAVDLKSIENSSNFDISTTNFDECHESSQTNFDFLLVVLVDDRSSSFAENILLSEQFRDFFDKTTGTYKDTQIYMSNIEKSPEAFEVSKVYKAKRFPYVCLLGNVSNNPAVMSSMSIVYKSNLFLGDSEEDNSQIVNRMFRHINKCLTNYSPQLVTKKYDKQEIEMCRLIKEKQDEAYLESLQQDKVKKEEKERKLKEEISNKNLQNLKVGYLTHLASSEWFLKRVDEIAPKDLVRVSIKLPNGKRVIQKFLKTAPLKEVHLFVELQLFDNPEDVEAVDMEPDEYYGYFEFGFELFKPLPKLTLPSSMQSIEEFGELRSGDNILVEYLDE